MKFVENEMVFLNSITKGEHVFGIPLRFMDNGNHRESVDKTIQGLMEKKVLKSETELDRFGVLPAKALEEYKEAATHIIINYLHIAPVDEQDCIVIVPLPNHEYDISRIPKIIIMEQLLVKYPVLRQAGKELPEEMEHVDMDTVLQEIHKADGNIITGHFHRRRKVEEMFYYWNKEQIYAYNLHETTREEVDASRVRRKFLELLQLNEGEESKRGE